MEAPELKAILDAAADAFDAGQLEEAHALTEKALRVSPASPAAQHLRAAIEVERGDDEAAAESYARALELAPDDVDILLGAADFQISVRGEERDAAIEGLRLCGRGRKLARRQGLDDLAFEFALLEGIGLNQLGENEDALERLDEALQLSPSSVEARLERGLALFELCRFDAAQRELHAVIDAAPDEAWAHHYLGLIAERKDDGRTAKKQFARAHALSPEDFPTPVKLEEAQFDAAVEAAVQRLPAQVKQYLENTTIAVEPIPSDEDLTGSRPPLSPCILGVFRGTPVGHRSVTDASDHFPASIVLYQRNLERFAKTREELIEQIGITLMHEVGHLIGLDEEDLWERGLD